MFFNKKHIIFSVHFNKIYTVSENSLSFVASCTAGMTNSGLVNLNACLWLPLVEPCLYCSISKYEFILYEVVSRDKREHNEIIFRMYPIQSSYI